MIKVNGQAYTAAGSNNLLAKITLRLNEMTDEQIVKFGAEEDFSKSQVALVRALLKELEVILPERIILLSLGILSGQPNDYIAYVGDILEKFPRGVPTITRLILDIYPEGFYTDRALEKRIQWMNKNKESLKRPEIMNFVEA